MVFVVPNQLFLLSKHYEVEIKSILLVVSEPFHSPLHHFTLHANHHNMNEPTLISLDDNASPHVEKQFKQWLEQQFAQRDWFIANQPPCSPTCNVNDAYLFPGLSKKVTRTQGVDFSGRTLKKEELWLLAKNEFERYSLEKLSSAFVQNEQVACAIAGDKGWNEHTKVKGAMHFNIRKTCLPWYSNSDDGDSGPVEDENGNVRVRKAIGVHVAEEYESRTANKETGTGIEI